MKSRQTTAMYAVGAAGLFALTTDSKEPSNVGDIINRDLDIPDSGSNGHDRTKLRAVAGGNCSQETREEIGGRIGASE